MTYSPDVLSKKWINRILNVTSENLTFLKEIEFDWLINLDKDPIAIALAKSIKAKRKSGFTMDEFGHAKPISTEAEESKWLTGLFDSVSKENKKHYVQEIFDISGLDFNNEEYILELDPNLKNNWQIDKSKAVIGLNTGCGGRWTSRLWAEKNWIKLAKDLLDLGYEVVLLGGEQEDKKNNAIAKESGAKYFGFFSLPVFMTLVNECNIVVTAVSMSMHIAMALKKEVIIFNNIFNKNEFYLYGRGAIVEPDFDCDCYFTPECPNNCMQYLSPEKVLKVLTNYLGLII